MIGGQFAPNVPKAHKSFWTYPMDHLSDIGHLESRFNPFGDSVIFSARSVHSFAKHRLEIVLDASDGTPR
jgi:hypothetical protein